MPHKRASPKATTPNVCYVANANPVPLPTNYP